MLLAFYSKRRDLCECLSLQKVHWGRRCDVSYHMSQRYPRMEDSEDDELNVEVFDEGGVPEY